MKEFIDTVEYFIYPHPYLEARSFGRYSFEFDPTSPDVNVTYCLSQDVDLTPYEDMGFILETYGGYTVAHHPENSN